MPAQTGKSGLLAKLGNRLVHAAEKHKNDEIVVGRMGLPGGIENGIAKLVDLRFVEIGAGKKNAGEYVFIGAGIVVAPEKHNGITIKGLRTSFNPEPIFDTPDRVGEKARRTFDEHVAWAQNLMKSLGASPESVGGTSMEMTAAALVKAGIYFRFSTWKPPTATSGLYAGKESKVIDTWGGRCDFVSNEATPAAIAAVEDHSDPNADGAADESPVDEPAEAVDTEVNGDGGGNVQLPDEAALTALATRADTKGKSADKSAAQAELMEYANSAGVAEEDVSKAASWIDVVAMIMATGGGDGATEAPATEEEFKPAKGDVFAYTPVDAKGKPLVDARTKKAIKPQQCEVTAVDAKSNTCSLKNLATNVIYKGVDWESLESAQ